jgi:hypothetical protein
MLFAGSDGIRLYVARRRRRAPPADAPSVEMTYNVCVSVALASAGQQLSYFKNDTVFMI